MLNPSRCTNRAHRHQVQAVISTFLCDMFKKRKSSSEYACVLTNCFCCHKWGPWCVCQRVCLCVRQSGVTKQQARTQPWGSIIENTQTHTHMAAYPHSHRLQKAHHPVTPQLILYLSLSVIDKLVRPVWHINTNTFSAVTLLHISTSLHSTEQAGMTSSLRLKNLF